MCKVIRVVVTEGELRAVSSEEKNVPKDYYKSIDSPEDFNKLRNTHLVVKQGSLMSVIEYVADYLRENNMKELPFGEFMSYNIVGKVSIDVGAKEGPYDMILIAMQLPIKLDRLPKRVQDLIDIQESMND
jgi:hypothetical protein